MTKTTTEATKPAWVHVAWLVVAFGTVVLLIWIVLAARALTEFTRTASPLWFLAAMLTMQAIVAFAAWWTVRRIRTLLMAVGGALLVGYLVWAVALPPVAPWVAVSTALLMIGLLGETLGSARRTHG